MNRGLIVGAIGFVLGYAAERVYTAVAPDIARYNRMREISGQEPLFKEVLAFAGSLMGSSGANDMIAEITNDVVRYARMKGM
jgi:hypothetical protein